MRSDALYTRLTHVSLDFLTNFYDPPRTRTMRWLSILRIYHVVCSVTAPILTPFFPREPLPFISLAP